MRAQKDLKKKKGTNHIKFIVTHKKNNSEMKTFLYRMMTCCSNPVKWVEIKYHSKNQMEVSSNGKNCYISQSLVSSKINSYNDYSFFR